MSDTQKEFCDNEVHDWKYVSPTERICKGCGVEHIHIPEEEWIPKEKKNDEL